MKADADPNLTVYFDGRYLPLAEARVGILTHALHYGTGVFEGIRAHWNEELQEMFLMRPVEHYQRWKQNCGILRIDIPLSPEELSAISTELIRRNGLRTNVYIRPIAYKSAERVGVACDDQDAFAIVALPFGDYLPTGRGLRAGVSSWRRIDDNAIPARAKICGAYVNSALATDEARRNGFDEALLLNESGHVTEGSTCNIFMVRKGKLITPAVTENVLEGITRDAVMELVRRELGLEIVERPIDRSELYVCDELFLTGTAVGISPVVEVDHRPVKDGLIGAVTREIEQLYFDATRGHLQTYSNWLMPVYQARKEDKQKQGAPAVLSAG
ncbi:MAG: branched-chain amino acid transaminase [Terracidiphilus sp.]